MRMSTSQTYYPMKVLPIYKETLWGGHNLSNFHEELHGQKIAESWVLSCHQDGEVLVANGAHKGKCLGAVLSKDVSSYIGGHYAMNSSTLPILIKLIDTEDDLSIQVHPSNETANSLLGEEGKAELWYILDCDKDSYIYLGLKDTIPIDALRKHLQEGTILPLLNKVNIHKGDFIYVPGGTIHALGKNILLAEIQQNSNTTFRLYDYLRMDSTGKHRKLHLEEGLRILDNQAFSPSNVMQFSDIIQPSIGYLGDYFSVHAIEFSGCREVKKSTHSFQSLLFLEGEGFLHYKDECYPFRKGDSYFLPAYLEVYKLSGQGKYLLTEV